MENKNTVFTYLCIAMLCFLFSCTSVTVDQVKHKQVEMIQGDSIVVIGRRSGSDYETEPDLIACIGSALSQTSTELNVIPESDFVDKLYPWFEARTAPVHVQDLNRLLSYEKISKIIDDYQVQYIVWVDGNTEKIRSSGNISCGLSPTGAACFGFGTWDTKSEYEATIWDYKSRQLVGKVSSVADGTSYMPAIIIPIPIIAPVQRHACKTMATQLSNFFTNK